MIAPRYCGSSARADGLFLCARLRDLKIRPTVRQEILVDRKVADRVPFDRRRRGVILADVDPRGACPGPLRLPSNSRPDRSRILLLFVLYSFPFLGLVTGQMMGQGRTPAVMGWLPAVLTLLGGIAIYLVAAKGLQTQALVGAMGS